MAVALAPSPLLTSTGVVSPRPSRRRFTAAFKRQFLVEAARCTRPGELGALLRREGLYTSHLAQWRAAERRGELAQDAPARRRGPARTPIDPAVMRIAALERELATTIARAERAEALVAVQKKVAALLEQLDAAPEPARPPSPDAARTKRR